MPGPRNPYEPTNNRKTDLSGLDQDPLQNVLLGQIQGTLGEAPPSPRPIPESGIALGLMHPGLMGTILSNRTQGPEFEAYEQKQKQLPSMVQAYGSLAGTGQRRDTAAMLEQGRTSRAHERLEEQADRQMFDQANKYGVSIYDPATGQTRERSAIQAEIAASSQKARASKQNLERARAAHLRALQRYATERANKAKAEKGGKAPDPLQMARYATSIYNQRMAELVYSDEYNEADERGKQQIQQRVFEEARDMADQSMEYYSGVPGANPRIEPPNRQDQPSGNPLLDAINAERARRSGGGR